MRRSNSVRKKVLCTKPTFFSSRSKHKIVVLSEYLQLHFTEIILGTMHAKVTKCWGWRFLHFATFLISVVKKLLLPSKNENFRLIFKHCDFCKERCGFSSTIPWLNYEWFFRSWEATQRLDGLKCQVEAIFQIFCRFELDTPLCVITLATLIDKPNKKVSFLMHTNINEWSKIRRSIEIWLQIS